MIVVEVNVLAYLLIPGKYTASAELVLEADAHWVAPRLWRSEFRNILATCVQSNLLALADAVQLFQRAKELIGSEEYEAETSDVFTLSHQSNCSAYDCEYIAVAEFLGAKLVTADAKRAKAFPQWTRLLSTA